MAIEVRMTGRAPETVGAPETVDQAVHRLAAEARKMGITVYKVAGPRGPAWFSPSQSRPGTAHALTAVSCDCDGFLRWQRCRHLARLLDTLGWLPVIGPDPGPPAPAIGRPSAPPCASCRGRGWSYSAWFASSGATRPPCRQCAGSGDARAAA